MSNFGGCSNYGGPPNMNMGSMDNSSYDGMMGGGHMQGGGYGGTVIYLHVPLPMTPR